MFQKWQSITLWKRVLIGLFVGLAIGLVMRWGLGIDTAKAVANTAIKPFGDAFVRLIRMLIIPLISTTLVAGVTAMGDPKKLGTLGVRTIAMYLATTFFAVSLGLLLGTLLRPGAGVDYETAGAEAIDSVRDKIETADAAGGIVERLLNIIPTNPVEALANGAVLPTIFFAILIGVGILLAGAAADPVKHFFEAAAEVVMRVTMLVMEMAPYGVLALMAWVMATQGIEILWNMGKLAVALYLACGMQIVFVYGISDHRVPAEIAHQAVPSRNRRCARSCLLYRFLQCNIAG